MAILRRTSIYLSSVSLVATLGVLTSPLAAHAALGSPTASTLIAAAKSALAKEKGVHVSVSAINGKADNTVSADIGRTSGTETYVSGNESFTITVTPSYAYLSGSKLGLTTLMGLSAAEQKKVGTAAISMKKGSTEYTSFETNLTSAAFSELVPPLKGTTLLSKRDKKTNGFQLTWSAKATSSTPKTTSVMTISSGIVTLPIKEKVTTSTSVSNTTFTHWGETVVVKVPSKTIAYSKIF